MSTLAVVEEILRTSGAPITVREIVARAGARLPSKSKTPDTVVARDLAMDIKRQGDSSRFVRASPGRYTLRELVAPTAAAAATSADTAETTPIAATALKQDRAAALPAKRDAPRQGTASSSAG
ncbi:MAG: winged helix-turn-helix domain-containing protein [Myxococcales bacterium]|nr:winged helix-turn-helix domain-containing protein [Myxococcales bacterium]